MENVNTSVIMPNEGNSNELSEAKEKLNLTLFLTPKATNNQILFF
jgi:hypothetical protein